MKFLNSLGPNPRMVRMFMLEKGIALPTVEHDIFAGDNRRPPYSDKNPGAQMPALELDDGTCIGETVAICEYLEESNPKPALIGSNAKERAEARMWIRRVELNVTEFMYNGFRFAEGLELFKSRMRCLPEAAAGLKAKGQDGLKWLDGLLAGKQFLCGDRLTVADLVLYCCLDFCGGVGQPLDPALENVNAWFARMNARPSATASLHPGAAGAGMRA
ncbi:MAG: glutathione S-transferase family protein [Gammaproteobacteria bacterium]|nr:glutathione S-transferase family protein [Gammaproteobacteria bacterium]